MITSIAEGVLRALCRENTIAIINTGMVLMTVAEYSREKKSSSRNAVLQRTLKQLLNYLKRFFFQSTLNLGPNQSASKQIFKVRNFSKCFVTMR